MDYPIYMNIALLEAKKAFLKEEVPIGALIVKNNIIIAKAYNQKDHKNMVTKHAELIAIEKASKKLKNWRLDDCDIYITLEPCPMCASAIRQSRIGKVIYGASSKDLNNFSIISTILQQKYANKPVEIIKNINSKECTEILEEFFRKKRI